MPVVDGGTDGDSLIQALLELDCFPCSMEFFPAANEEVWEAIKGLIKDCDYYLVIVAGKYGSINEEEGISYTRKEYEFAVQNGIPVVAFLHGSPDELERRKTEIDSEKQKKLEEFRELCKQRMCKGWMNQDDLRAVVTTSLVSLMKKKPAVGWVRANHVPDEGAAQTILRLRNENDELKKQIEIFGKDGIPGTEKLAQANDRFDIHYWFRNAPSGSPPLSAGGQDPSPYQGTISLTWNQIFVSIGLGLMTASNEEEMVRDLGILIKDEGFRGGPQEILSIEIEDFKRIKVQLRALGYIQKNPSGESRSWTLTPFGERLITQLKAITH